MSLLTREQAVVELIDGAIEACFDGHYACAITLAGAAEGAIPHSAESLSFYKIIRTLFIASSKCAGKEADQILNYNRNWLKHFSRDKSAEIDTEFSWFYVIRAHVQFKIAYPSAKQTIQMKRLQDSMDDETEPVRVWFGNLMSVADRLKREAASKQSENHNNDP